MYSYLHKFHAGNFADVHKHIVLLNLIDYLKIKNNPFCVLDAFAGEGLYDLQSNEAQLNKEFISGFQAVLNLEKPTPLLQSYIDVIRSFNPESDTFRFYPGSPAVSLNQLREHDKLIAIENHPASFKCLQAQFKRAKNIHMHQRDAFEALTALVPFKEKRGLIFVDPSYEVKSEYKSLPLTIEKAHKKMPNAMIAIWYPILNENYHQVLVNTLCAKRFDNIYQCEWIPNPNQTQGLIGSGMIIINHGWNAEAALNQTFNMLNKSIFKDGVWLSKVIRAK